jgi:hypothetical protein
MPEPSAIPHSFIDSLYLRADMKVNTMLYSTFKDICFGSRLSPKRHRDRLPNIASSDNVALWNSRATAKI